MSVIFEYGDTQVKDVSNLVPITGFHWFTTKLSFFVQDVTITAALLSFIKDSTIYTHKISFPSEVKKSVLKVRL